MKKIIYTSICILLFSCGKEDMLEKEKKEMQEFIENKDLVVYRGLKVSLRSISTTTIADSSEFKNASKIQALSFALLQKILGVKSDSTFSFTDYFSAMSEVSELKDELAKWDEDKFPTILHNMFSITGADSGNLLSKYNSSCEHIILSLTWTGMGAPESFSVYEMIKSKPEEISDPLFRLSASFIKGMILNKKKWNYTAEKEFSDYISFLEKNRKQVVEELNLSSIYKEQNLSEEQIYAGLHGPALFMRGLCKLESEREDEAEKDFELFVKDADKAGVDDEGVWMIRAYVAINNENKEEAVKMLDKLSASEKFSSDEKAVIEEVKKFTEDREKGKALNRITDKMFIAKIAYIYAEKQIASVDWYSEIQKSETGAKFSDLAGAVKENYDLISGNTTNVIKDKAQDLWNSVTK